MMVLNILFENIPFSLRGLNICIRQIKLIVLPVMRASCQFSLSVKFNSENCTSACLYDEPTQYKTYSTENTFECETQTESMGYETDVGVNVTC